MQEFPTFTTCNYVLMENASSPRQKIALLTVLMAVLMLPPMLSFFNRSILVGGIPVLYLYVSMVWLAYIGLVWWQAKKLDDQPQAPHP